MMPIVVDATRKAGGRKPDEYAQDEYRPPLTVPMK